MTKVYFPENKGKRIIVQEGIIEKIEESGDLVRYYIKDKDGENHVLTGVKREDILVFETPGDCYSHILNKLQTRLEKHEKIIRRIEGQIDYLLNEIPSL